MNIVFARSNERADVAARIDPKTATIFWQGRMGVDPYGDLAREELEDDGPGGPIPQNVQRFYFLCGPDGKAVLVEDLPAEIREALYAAELRCFHLHPDDMDDVPNPGDFNVDADCDKEPLR